MHDDIGDDTDLDARPAIVREPVHPSISHAQISELVDRFYDAIWSHPVLGPIFTRRVEDRAAHLDRMKRFWSSVLLRTGAYKGRPVPAHVRLGEVRSEDFALWLSVFRPVARDVFAPEAAPLVIAAAERIATSLWLAMFGTPFNRAPDLTSSETNVGERQ